MPTWTFFVALTILCWGAYVPTLHQGQTALGQPAALRAFLFVGLAYCITSALVVAYLRYGIATNAPSHEPWVFNAKGSYISLFAGILGAIGALGIVFAMKFKGNPLIVAPLVFAGAPIVNTLVSMAWHKPAKSPSILFYMGLLLAAAGAAMVLRFKPQ